MLILFHTRFFFFRFIHFCIFPLLLFSIEPIYLQCNEITPVNVSFGFPYSDWSKFNFKSIFCLAGKKGEMPFAGSEAKTQEKHSEDSPGLLDKIKKVIFG